jgi:hypothetical protein
VDEKLVLHGGDLAWSGGVRPCPVVTSSQCPMCAHGSVRDIEAAGV